MEDSDDWRLERFVYRTRTASRWFLRKWSRLIDQELTRPRSTSDVEIRSKAILARLARELGFCCHASGERGRKEFLYDIVWTDEPDDKGNFHDVFLIAEIELAKSEQKIMEDFRKLLLGRAPIKVMVFCVDTDPDHYRTKLKGADLRKKMTELIHNFRNTEEQEVYILVDGGYDRTSDLIVVTDDNDQLGRPEDWPD